MHLVSIYWFSCHLTDQHAFIKLPDVLLRTYANLVRQAKSKQKILDKMYEAGLTKPVQHRASFTFSFPDCDKLPPPVLPFVDVSFSYSGKEEDMLYRVSHWGPAALVLRCVNPHRPGGRHAAPGKQTDTAQWL